MLIRKSIKIVFILESNATVPKRYKVNTGSRILIDNSVYSCSNTDIL